MSNEFVARKGLISLKSSSFDQTLFVSGSIYSPKEAFLTSSYAITASYVSSNAIDFGVENISSSVVLTSNSKPIQNAVITSSININLPLVVNGVSFILKKSDTSSYRAHVIASPGQLIDGYATQSLTSYGDAMYIAPNKITNNWIII